MSSGRRARSIRLRRGRCRCWGGVGGGCFGCIVGMEFFGGWGVEASGMGWTSHLFSLFVCGLGI